ncbi:MAG: helix-turn-helix domain-containing protein, partial [Methylococcales bacterium]|nr:helix-turn-helix domain-containing protein [Methylococcales bacterium]
MHRVRIYPTQSPATLFKKWINTCRYVYNRTSSAVRGGEKCNKFQLRNRYVLSTSVDGRQRLGTTHCGPFIAVSEGQYVSYIVWYTRSI